MKNTNIDFRKEIGKFVAKETRKVNRANDVNDVIGTIGTCVTIGSVVVRGALFVLGKI